MTEFDPATEFKNLEAEEHQELLHHDAVQRILQITREDTKEYRFGELSIRVLAAIPKDQRRVVTQLRRLALHETAEDDEEIVLGRSEELFYTFLARMCPDEPFNHPETWQYIDEETGVVPRVAVQVIELCAEDEKRVAEFRPK